MKVRSTCRITSAAMMALAAAPAVNAFAATTASTHKYKGPAVDMRWGPVQATIYVKGKKITKVSISTSPENTRSSLIDEQAVPLLKQETLTAQSANIDMISGATLTSAAFAQSLQAALVKAHLVKASG